MSIYISNALYLAEADAGATTNRPLIGWKSVLNPVDFSSSFGANAGIMWSPDTYTYWESDPDGGGSEFDFEINLANPSASAVDYIAIAGHNFYDNASGSPYSVQLFYSYDNVTFAECFSIVTPISNNALMVYFDSVAAQYFKLVITSQPCSETTAKIAHLRMGRVLRLQRRVYVGINPFTLNLKVDKTVSVSDSGKYLGAHVKSVVNSYKLPQIENTPLFIRENIMPFLKHISLLEIAGNNGPPGTFFGAWRPDDYPDEVLYCHPGQITWPANQHPNGVMQWEISGEAEA